MRNFDFLRVDHPPVSVAYFFIGNPERCARRLNWLGARQFPSPKSPERWRPEPPDCLTGCYFVPSYEVRAYAGMNNKPYRRNFTPSDDALILEQPVTRIGLKTLATMLHTSHETLMRRADELGVSLAISHDEAVDTRALRRSDELVDPLLERLKRAHGDRK